MNSKNNKGLNLGTILWFVLSFVAAVVFWLFVEYSEAVATLSYFSPFFMLN